MIIAVDVDGMLTSFPDFFVVFFKAMQQGNKVGILTARPNDQRDANLANLKDLGIEPDFFIGKPDELSHMPDGVFKAKVCNEMGVDVLFDDFECSDPTMCADFFSHNTETLVFTSWAYEEGKV